MHFKGKLLTGPMTDLVTKNITEGIGTLLYYTHDTDMHFKGKLLTGPMTDLVTNNIIEGMRTLC